jgi:hypothetical protein
VWLDLLGESENAPQAQEAHEALLEHPQVQDLLTELKGWPGTPIGHHRNAGLLLHKLTFIADLGLRIDDPGVEDIVQKILEHQSPNGPFLVAARAGKGQYFTWMLCDAPLILYALVKFGFNHDSRVQAAVDYLVSLVRDTGWPCAIERKDGRDPARGGDPCPYANLVMLKLLSQVGHTRYEDACRAGAEAILSLWERSRELHPHEFYMGTDFRKLRAPLVWYDILHMVEVLSQFQWLHNDPRLLEMIELVKNKADNHGRFTPESVYRAWKGWVFGQKREPSRWLTLLVQRVIMRMS